MEITCHRCHQAVPAESCYCPSCGLPQLVYTSEGVEGPGEAERWTQAVRDAGSVEWKPALRVALLLALPAGLLFCALTPVGFLSFFWMVATSALTVALYSRRQRPAWVTLGAGARIGLVTGLLTGWLVLVIAAGTFFAARFFLHLGPAVDGWWRDFVNLRLDQQWQSSGVDQPTISAAKSWLLSAEGRSGFLLALLAILEVMLLLCSAAGGALGAKMMIRGKNRE